MKKSVLLVFALVAVLVFGASSAYAQELSVGYQGLIGNGQNMLSGLSVRGWSNQVGYEGTIFFGEMGVDTSGDDFDADIWVLDAQVMYAAIVKENSKFYVGLDLGYGQYDLEDFGMEDDDFWMVGPLIGAQYSFQGLPELGFNWEVSYDFLQIDADDTDIDLDGINVTLGVHYQF